MKKAVFIKYRTVIPGHRLHRDCKAIFEALQQEIEAIPPYSLPIKDGP